jgi:hypothetical protein
MYRSPDACRHASGETDLAGGGRQVTRSRARRTVSAFGIAALLVSIGAGSALAGEVTGNGKSTPISEFRAKSICSFSGQNDRVEGEGPVEPRVQNWGTIPKVVRDELALHGEHPGDACNGHTGFLSGGE